jgi:hypothetical protein
VSLCVFVRRFNDVDGGCTVDPDRDGLFGVDNCPLSPTRDREDDDNDEWEM